MYVDATVFPESIKYPNDVGLLNAEREWLVKRIKGRIVSFARPYVRPVVRGKNGKEVEFGSKAGCVHVDGFVFLDHLEHRAFAEEGFVKKHVETYKERFGKAPSSFTADKKYGTKDNREYLEKEGIRVGFKALGRKRKDAEGSSRWLKKKQRERNRIEGDFGNGKEHYGLDRVLYSIENGSEIWVRLGLLGMNLKTALRKIQLKPSVC